MFLKFGEWISHQQNREDDIGYLARVLAVQDVEQKLSRRKPDEHKAWVDVVTKIDEPGYIRAFNDAWQEYLEVRQATKGKMD